MVLNIFIYITIRNIQNILVFLVIDFIKSYFPEKSVDIHRQMVAALWEIRPVSDDMDVNKGNGYGKSIQWCQCSGKPHMLLLNVESAQNDA